jgi:hypothetical protein
VEPEKSICNSSKRRQLTWNPGGTSEVADNDRFLHKLENMSAIKTSCCERNKGNTAATKK